MQNREKLARLVELYFPAERRAHDILGASTLVALGLNEFEPDEVEKRDADPEREQEEQNQEEELEEDPDQILKPEPYQ